MEFNSAFKGLIMTKHVASPFDRQSKLWSCKCLTTFLLFLEWLCYVVSISISQWQKVGSVAIYNITKLTESYVKIGVQNPYTLPLLRPKWDSGSLRRWAGACSADWIRRSDNLISCDVPIITTAFEERQAAGSCVKEGVGEGLYLRPVLQNRGPRVGQCSGVKLSFSLPPAGTYNYSQGPHSETLPTLHNPSSLHPRSQRPTVPEVQEGLRL
jgi:hypothetical protein